MGFLTLKNDLKVFAVVVLVDLLAQEKQATDVTIPLHLLQPVNPYAAILHGYGPVLLAGAEMISLLKNSFPNMNDNAVMFYPEEVKTDAPIFN